jgi:hypothetical protein
MHACTPLARYVDVTAFKATQSLPDNPDTQKITLLNFMHLHGSFIIVLPITVARLGNSLEFCTNVKNHYHPTRIAIDELGFHLWSTYPHCQIYIQ